MFREVEDRDEDYEENMDVSSNKQSILDCWDLVSRALEPDLKDRITLFDALSHPFIIKQVPVPLKIDDVMMSVIKNSKKSLEMEEIEGSKIKKKINDDPIVKNQRILDFHVLPSEDVEDFDFSSEDKSILSQLFKNMSVTGELYT
jgi:serine/threonine protein kinase